MSVSLTPCPQLPVLVRREQCRPSLSSSVDQEEQQEMTLAQIHGVESLVPRLLWLGTSQHTALLSAM